LFKFLVKVLFEKQNKLIYLPDFTCFNKPINMTIGVLRETDADKRVSILPEHIAKLSKLNFNILVEENAGKESFFSDQDYIDKEAALKKKDEILKEADVIFKISFTEEEIESLPEGKMIFSVLNPLMRKSLVEKLQAKKITAFSLDIVPRTTRAQSMDVLSSMATIAGYKAVLDAAGNLPKFFPMFMSAAGTIKPAKLLILGAGVAGLQSIATARKLGAVVEVFDVRAAVKEEVQSLGGKFIEVEGARDEASAGGYAVEQTEEFKQKQQQLIHDHAVKSDVIISTAQIPGKKAPLLIKKETVNEMKPGSLIIDLAASSGGNCELTKNGENAVENQVTIIGRSDYPGDMPVDASRMYGNNMINFLNIFVNKDGEFSLNFEDDLIKGTCVCHDGEIVSDRVKSFMNS